VRDRLDPGEVVTIGLPVAQALTVAHAAGLVHGRLGRDEILLEPNGRPVLAGVGLAALTDPGLTPATDVHDLADLLLDTMLHATGPDAAAVAVAVATALVDDPARRPDAAELAAALARSAAPTPVRMVADTVTPLPLPPPPPGVEPGIAGAPAASGGPAERRGSAAQARRRRSPRQSRQPAEPGRAGKPGQPPAARPDGRSPRGASDAASRDDMPTPGSSTAAGHPTSGRRPRTGDRSRVAGRRSGGAGRSGRAGDGAGAGTGHRARRRSGGPGRARRWLLPLVAAAGLTAVGLAIVLLAGGGSGDAPRGAVTAGSAGSSGGGTTATTVAGQSPEQVWRSVLAGLHGARSRAFERAQENLLADVDAAGSPAYGADVDLMRKMVARGAHAAGLRQEIVDLAVREEGADKVVLRITQKLDPYDFVNASGRVLARQTGTPPQRRDLTLVRTAAGWRISQTAAVTGG
jgi:hypothetical protein